MIFLIFSMKRSGQHAIINWMMAQSKGSRHFNNCKIKNKVLVTKRGGKRIENGDCLTICNIEDRRINMSFEHVKYIVILRDPFNLVASRLYTDYLKMGTKMRTRWKSHVKKALTDERIIDINYNEWFKDVNYRRQLADRLGLSFTDAGLNRIPKIGGSSFDGNRYDGKAQQMDVMNRWKSYVNNKSFWKEIDGEMVELSKQYFDFVVGRDYVK